MLGYYNYSVIVTYIGLASSIFGITQVIEAYSGHGDYSLPFLCLLLSGLCDMFDGKIARKMKNRTEREKIFGIQIDSLCDLVCFGVFPAILGYSLGFNYGLGLAAAYFIIQGAVIRLGFFNVMEQERQKQTDENRVEYRGLPVTSVAIILPIIYLGKAFVGMKLFPYIFQIFMIIIGILFLLKFKIKKPHLRGILLLFTIGILILIGFIRGQLK